MRSSWLFSTTTPSIYVHISALMRRERWRNHIVGDPDVNSANILHILETAKATPRFLFRIRQKKGSESADALFWLVQLCLIFSVRQVADRETWKKVILTPYSENNRWSRKCAINIEITLFIRLWKMSRSTLTRAHDHACVKKRVISLIPMMPRSSWVPFPSH